MQQIHRRRASVATAIAALTLSGFAFAGGAANGQAPPSTVEGPTTVAEEETSTTAAEETTTTVDETTTTAEVTTTTEPVIEGTAAEVIDVAIDVCNVQITVEGYEAGTYQLQTWDDGEVIDTSSFTIAAGETKVIPYRIVVKPGQQAPGLAWNVLDPASGYESEGIDPDDGDTCTAAASASQPAPAAAAKAVTAKPNYTG